MNWDELFLEFVKSNLQKNEFLKSRKINPNDMISKRKTDKWVEKKNKIKFESVKNGSVTSSSQRLAQMMIEPIEMDSANKRPAQDPMAEPDLSVYPKQFPVHSDNKAINKYRWEIINNWRQTQSEQDYKLADMMRLHCKLILKDYLEIYTDDNGNKKYKTHLSATALNNIVKTVESIQRIQRLALGMSTENIGVEIDNVVETVEQNIPVFEVQMSSGGRFLKVR